MTAILRVIPQPVAPGAVVQYLGAGFDPKRKHRLTLDGVGATTNVGRPSPFGTFSGGMKVAPTPRTMTLVAQQLSGSTWTETARIAVVVGTQATGTTWTFETLVKP